jgi:Ca2+-binding RTX toxin-like protein
MITYRPLDTSTYSQDRYFMLFAVEQFRADAYYDSAAIPTIGIGFNLRAMGPQVIDQILGSQAGFTKPQRAADNAYRQQLSTAFSATYGSDSELDQALNAIMAARAKDAAVPGASKPTTFTLTEAEGKHLFNHIADGYETGLTGAITTVVPDSMERIALFSLEYNSPALIGAGLNGAIGRGDRAEAWYEIRYDSNSNAGGSAGRIGLAKRRYYESQVFGATNGSMTVDDAKDLLVTRSRHIKQISAYDTKFGGEVHAANHDYAHFHPLVTVQSSKAIFNEAKGVIEGQFARGNAVDEVIYDYKPIHSGSEDSQETNTITTVNYNIHLGALILAGEGNDTVTGSSHNDVIWGGPGNDTIDGGAGKDVAEYTGKAIDYDIVHKPGSSTWTITHVRGDMTEGKDSLVNVESAQFADNKFALAANGITDQTDLGFVIDTTGSMGPYIDSVKAAADSIISAAFKGGQQDTHIGVVSFKDPTQGDPNAVLLAFQSAETDLSVREQDAVAAINALSIGGGGDIPETDYAGLLLALDGDMGEWRDSAAVRRIVLFTDAPAKDAGSAVAAEVFQLANDLGVSGVSEKVANGTTGSFLSATLSDASDDSSFNLQIFTIALGSDPQAAADMAAIAAATNGETFNAVDGDTLVQELFKIINLPASGGLAIVSDGGGTGATVRIDESLTYVTRVHASDDAPHTHLTYSIAGGSDAAQFTIDAHTGVLEFANPPDYEAPTDSDGNNLYDVIVAASDGALSAEQDITVRVRDIANEVYGTGAADRLHGSAAPDLISARGGNDTAFGLAGGDVLHGGLGQDRLYGGLGDDKIYGDAGADKIVGGYDNDRIAGGAGDDLISGSAGDDILAGGAGDDIIRGGTGSDRLSGGDGNDKLTAGSDASQLLGGAGGDVLTGGAGDDLLQGGAGNDVLTGGLGNDTFSVAAHSGRDVITDFGVGDIVALSAKLGIADFADLQSHIVQVGASTVIAFDDGDSIVLHHVLAASLTADQFTFG